jgi:hypothetical protein
MRWFWKLTGGRPMQMKDCLFIDQVSGKEVFLWVDRLGRQWMANMPLLPFVTFRVRR